MRNNFKYVGLIQRLGDYNDSENIKKTFIVCNSSLRSHLPVGNIALIKHP